METCKEKNCDRPTSRRGYCSPHYQRLMKYGDPQAGGIFRDPDRQRKPCSIKGCDEHRYARTWCSLHWSRWNRHGDPLWIPAKREKLACAVEGCAAMAIARGWCQSHYGKWNRHGDPLFVSTPQTRRKSSGSKDRHGYKQIYCPENPNARKDGRVMEHVVVMSEHVGRPIRKGETVHHRNGIRDDNRIENLELWVSAHPRGQRVTDLVAFARDVLDRYEDEAARLF